MFGIWLTNIGVSFATFFVDGNDDELSVTDVFDNDWIDVIAMELLVAFVVVVFVVIDVDDVDGADVNVGGYWKTFGCEAAFGVVIGFVSFIEFDAYSDVFATVVECKDWMLCGNWICALFPLLSLLLFEFTFVVWFATVVVWVCIVCGT